MGKLSRRIGELKSRGGGAPDKRDSTRRITNRQPIAQNAGWAMGPRPSPPPLPSPSQNLLFLAFVAVLIIAMNAIFWGGSSELPTIDAATGRQVNESVPWE